MQLSRHGVIRGLMTSFGLLMGVLLTGGCAERLVIYPSRVPLPTPGLTRQMVGQGDQAVEVWIHPPDNGVQPQGYVISFNGNSDRAEWAANRMAWQWSELPLEVWAVNYPGFGGSAGECHLASITPAALSVYDHLKKQIGDKPIIVDGNSLGTTAALSLAARRPVDFVVLTHPPALKQLILGEHGWWNGGVFAKPVADAVPPELDSLANAAQCTVPALILISDFDTVVAPKYQRQVVAAYAGPAVVLKVPGDHNNPLPHDVRQQARDRIKILWVQALVRRMESAAVDAGTSTDQTTQPGQRAVLPSAVQ